MITEADVLVLAHTARMVRILTEDSPSHKRQSEARGGEYLKQIKIYSGKWAGLDSASQAAAKRAAVALDDMDADLISAAVAALEG